MLKGYYALNTTNLTLTLISVVITNGSLLGSSGAQRPNTLSNAQSLLGSLLQQVLGIVLSDWDSGAFLALASGGMLLNATGETEGVGG